uniref:Uncharacterized protein n=1 Tax=Ignisphaera aggregans TaxID=334771 RepID=A0A7J2U6B5_9CREN
MLRKVKAIIMAILITTLTSLVLFIVIGPAPFNEIFRTIFGNIFTLAAIAIFSFVVMLIGFVTILTTDNEYIAAIATILVYISIVVLITILPMLFDAMGKYFGQALSNFTKIFGSP